ncbi:hypothetical protein B0I03_10540 [Flavobacterium aquaticum]|uniref:Minor tail protein gp31 C-terminal domain-containing protein n=1 Tax=Flavobacterium aquaticum TaxID=1236486 RepID=A0A327YKS1_9FLAO|nr:hypothetical protein [Flavobacterium aquaticum]RAK21608.1 hypothetical protein B0I03_10540 [Flavobacterium aquaticum]
MHIINNINAKTFSHNGRNYVKNFIVIKQGENNIAIHNAYDTKFQLVGSTHFSQFQVNGVVYTSQADLMANLVNILFVKNLGAGAISNTSELINDGADGINPFVTTADLPSANKILNQTGYNLSGETLTINADWVWLIANQQYTNDDVVEINVPLASSGMTRIDLIVADNNNTFQRIAGTEAVDNAIAPPVPNNTIQATLIVVTDGIIEVEPTPTGDLYLEKADETIAYIGSSSGIITIFKLKNYTNYIIKDSSSVTQINSAGFVSPVFSYIGKRIRITNQQSTPIVFKHNFGAGELKFDLINDNDFILGTDETINFIIQDDYTLLHVAEININSLSTPTLQEVTDAGNTTSNVIVGNNGFTTSDAHSNFEIATNYTTGTRQLNFYIEGDEVDFPTSTSAQISTNLDNGTIITSTVSGNTTGFFVNGFDQGVTIGGTSGKFALLKTGLISGGTKSFEFPNQSGTLALTSDLSSATTSVWKKSGLINNANLVNEKIYRQNSAGLIGSIVSFGTAPTQSDLDNEILGSQFGHIFGGGTVPFIQLLGNGGNGSAGPNQFISRMAGAPTTMQQMTFSAIKSTNYDAWGDAGRLLWRFQDGYLYPQAKFDIGTDYVRLHSYPSTRNDTGDTMNNVLFTNSNGTLRSKSVAQSPFINKHTGTTYTTNALLTVTQAEYDAIVTKDPTTIYFII